MITQSELKSLLNYDKETGIFTWLVNRPKRPIGSIAGTKHNAGYVHIRVNNKKYLAHRLAWLYIHGEFPEFLDHINGIRDDNKISNLRIATKTENNCNKIMPKHNTSGFKGVSWHVKNKSWQASIAVNGIQIALGSYDDFEKACQAVIIGRAKYHGDFAKN